MEAIENITQLPFNQATVLSFLAMLLPFISFLFLIFFGTVVKRYRAISATTVMFIVTCLAFYLFFGIWNSGETHHTRFTWFSMDAARGAMDFTAGIYLDNISVLMLMIVTFISFLVHLFSIEYLRGDRELNKYFAYLGLFTFSMLGIILADNLLVIFAFWELVGLSSYLLIGFWYSKSAAVQASKKAFIVNRIGDVGFLIGILVLFAQFNTLDIALIKEGMKDSMLVENDWVVPGLFDAGAGAGMAQGWLWIAGLGLFFGCVGKSAQFPLQTWLPDAMEGPTPISALIHAATMVAAGVYLLSRVFVFIPLEIHTIIAFTGAITAFMGGVAALAQTDIKKVLAYSTISQLGYMMIGMGTGGYDAALFHLLTHAFFKACLFLAAGAIIHNMHELQEKLHHKGYPAIYFDAQDMRLMGSLRSYMPVIFIGYLVSSMALIGLPLFSGFLSKDAILAASWAWADTGSAGLYYLVPVMGFLTVVLTALYMGRQLLMVFYGPFKLEKVYTELAGAKQFIPRAPILMRIPVVALALLSLWLPFSLSPLSAEHGWFLSTIGVPEPLAPVHFQALGGEKFAALTEVAHQFHGMSSLLSVLLGVAGIGLAWWLYAPAAGYPEGRAVKLRFPYRESLWQISYYNWHLDTFYKNTIVRLTVGLSRLMAWFDRKVVDGLINFAGGFVVVFAHIIGWLDYWLVDGLVTLITRITGSVGKLARSLQGGRVQVYYIVSSVMFLVILLILVL